jgi:hypothetical protein
MVPRKMMLIRHAEKPDEQGKVLGVDESGTPNPNQLSVRGWQRAGALVRFFAPINEIFVEGIEKPASIIACKPANGANSVRSVSTVAPLAAALGMAVNKDIGCGDESALIEFLKENSQDAVLICWRHEPIPGIVRALAGNLENLPSKWPGKRFDLVWVLEKSDSGWSFKQVAQLLLAGDAPAAVVMPLNDA